MRTNIKAEITTREILANMHHVFFTPESARDFRVANLAQGNPIGTTSFANDMSFDFYQCKSSEGETFANLPDDRELMRIISEIPKG